MIAASRRRQAWAKLRSLFDGGRLAVLDGGVGTEVERLVRMRGDEHALDAIGWTAAQTVYNPEAVRDVHAAYINAGAQMITANTYAQNRSVLTAAGLGDRTDEINRRAVALANEAREAAPNADGVLVAGSMSAHPPIIDKDYTDAAIWPSPDVEAANLREQAAILASTGGVDLILCELLFDLRHGSPVVAAALETGLPVFVGFNTAWANDAAWSEPLSARSDGTTAAPAKLAGDEGTTVHDAVTHTLALPGAPENLAGFTIHHTQIDKCLKPLKAIRATGWEGWMACYPDHGVFCVDKSGEGDHHWDFHEVDNAGLLAAAASWVDEAGVQLLGGCCGTGPEQIVALAGFCDERNAR